MDLTPAQKIATIKSYYARELGKLLGTEDFKFIWRPLQGDGRKSIFDPSFGFLSGWYQLADQAGFEAAGFYLTQLPGCCGVLVSHNAHIVSGQRHKGLGTLLQAMRIDMAWVMGYTILLATDKVYNTYQRRIMAKHGWKDLTNFTNRRTGHVVAVSVLQLKEPDWEKMK